MTDEMWEAYGTAQGQTVTSWMALIWARIETDAALIVERIYAEEARQRWIGYLLGA